MLVFLNLTRPQSAGGPRPMPPGENTIHILLVEDCPDDAELMIEALSESSLPVVISHVEDGEDAIGFLRRQGIHASARRPDLILLDLNLPRMNGFEVIAELKDDPELKRIPVVLITACDQEEAFTHAYDLLVNCCVSKPVDQEEYTLTVKKIESFWLHTAQRPRWS